MGGNEVALVALQGIDAAQIALYARYSSGNCPQNGLLHRDGIDNIGVVSSRMGILSGWKARS